MSISLGMHAPRGPETVQLERCRKAQLAPGPPISLTSVPSRPANAVSMRPPCKAARLAQGLIHACLSNIRSSHSRSHRPKRAASPTGSVVWLKSKDGRSTSNNITAHLLISDCSTVTLRGPPFAKTSYPVRQIKNQRPSCARQPGQSKLTIDRRLYPESLSGTKV